MKLTVVRTQFGTDATNGLLFIDGIFECYVLEDQYQAFTEADMSLLKSKGYNESFMSLEKGVKSYLDWLSKNT